MSQNVRKRKLSVDIAGLAPNGDYEASDANGDNLGLSRDYGAFVTEGYKDGRIYMKLKAPGTARAGTFKLQERRFQGDDTDWIDIDMSLVGIHGNGNSATVATGAINMCFAFEDPGDEMRLVWTRTAGAGAADEFEARAVLYR